MNFKQAVELAKSGSEICRPTWANESSRWISYREGVDKLVFVTTNNVWSPRVEDIEADDWIERDTLCDACQLVLLFPNLDKLRVFETLFQFRGFELSNYSHLEVSTNCHIHSVIKVPGKYPKRLLK